MSSGGAPPVKPMIIILKWVHSRLVLRTTCHMRHAGRERKVRRVGGSGVIVI